MDLNDIEAQLLKVRQARDIEMAIDHCQRGVTNAGVIYKIAAESDYGVMVGQSRGGAERSINLVFTVDESSKIFMFVEKLIAARLELIKSELGAA